ncbi:MAG: hypothetical protein AMXMBFR84_13340 [Candidatus Hydrogenedentota bacterium]
MIRLLLGTAAGVIVGTLTGMSRSCESGTCPLTATPFRGAIYGGIMGFMLASMAGGPA